MSSTRKETTGPKDEKSIAKIPINISPYSFKFVTANLENFIMRIDQVIKKCEYPLAEKHHAAAIYHKKSKSSPSMCLFSSGTRDSNNWYGITNTLIKNHKNLYQIIMFISETARFIGGNLEVKYRYDPDAKILFSKGVNNAIQFKDYILRSHLSMLDIERYGTASFIHWLFENNDLNGGNCLVNEATDQLIIIDYDRCCPAVASKYVETDPCKYLTYDIGNHLKKTKFDDETYILEDKDVCFMGQMSVKDYNNLPFCEDQIATTWYFMNIYTGLQDFTTKGLFGLIARNKTTIAEKHFAALVTILSMDIFLEFANIHIADSKDRAIILEKLNERFDIKLTEILLQSFPATTQDNKGKSDPDSFKEFFKNNSIALMKCCYLSHTPLFY